MASPRPELLPIRDVDVGPVAQYLHDNLTQRVSPDQWSRAMHAPWQYQPPNHGVFLQVDHEVVGAYLALYSRRDIRGHSVQICNLAAWCVDEAYRFSSVRMLKFLLAQPDYQFTDLSPSGSVVGLNERLGFRHVDTATALVVNLPWPTIPWRCRVTSNPAEIASRLAGHDLEVYHDHASAPAVAHLLLDSPKGTCHVMYRRDRRKGLPLFASVLYASNPDVLASMRSSLCRHLLLRRGIPAMLAETRTTGDRIRPSAMLRTPRPKMFKSDVLQAEDIDNLYSELIAVAW